MATIVMSADKVIAAANKAINNILQYRKEMDQATIARLMRTKRFSFRRGFYYFTEIEANNFLDSQGWESRWGRCEVGWGDLDKARALLKLSEHGDPVTLNTDDVRVLF